MRWIEIKMRELGVSNHSDYKLTAFLDNTAMVTVHTAQRGVALLLWSIRSDQMEVDPFQPDQAGQLVDAERTDSSCLCIVASPVEQRTFDRSAKALISRVLPSAVLSLTGCASETSAAQEAITHLHANIACMHIWHGELSWLWKLLALAAETVCCCIGVFDCKPLPVLWGRFPDYTPDNTIMFDDLRRNYVFNPQNGLVIRPYKYGSSRCTACSASNCTSC